MKSNSKLITSVYFRVGSKEFCFLNLNKKKLAELLENLPLTEPLPCSTWKHVLVCTPPYTSSYMPMFTQTHNYAKSK